MKTKIATLAIAAAISLSAIAPVSAASMQLPALELGNADVTTVGYHGHYKKKHYQPKPKRHRHYHCHKRLVYGYWKKVCHKAWHNPWGRHHGHGYH